MIANGGDMRPSPLWPLYHLLSPAEWSKFLFACVLFASTLRKSHAAAVSTGGDPAENSFVGWSIHSSLGHQVAEQNQQQKAKKDNPHCGIW